MRNGFITTFLMIVLMLSGCEPERGPVMKAETDSLDVEVKPDQVSWNVEVIFADSSHTKALLSANHARVYSEQQKTYLDDSLEVEFLSRYTGQRVSLLTADSAEIDDRTKDMTARGNVVVISDSSQRRLETSVLNWNNKTQLFYSTEFVKIDSPEEHIEGYGFESDQNLENYKIFKVSGVQK